jgi:hypothetical protein
MFVQVIQGHTSDAEGMRDQLERWRNDIKPGAVGYLGSTAGIADDGTVVLIGRFDSAESAQANASRAEQSAWWNEAAKYFDDEPTFRESTDVRELFGGGSNGAGFVQVMDGTGADRARAEAWETPETLDRLRAARPDLLGGIRVWLDAGSYVEAAYFTSEADARRGETSEDFEMSEQDAQALFGDMAFIDLREPLLD